VAFHLIITSYYTFSKMVNTESSYTVDDNVRFINSTVNSVYELVALIPGSDIILNYLKESYQHDPFRVLLELFLVFFAIKYMLAKRYKPNDNSVKLTNKVCFFFPFVLHSKLVIVYGYLQGSDFFFFWLTHHIIFELGN
jgi:hypothetical protein